MRPCGVAKKDPGCPSLTELGLVPSLMRLKEGEDEKENAIERELQKGEESWNL